MRFGGCLAERPTLPHPLPLMAFLFCINSVIELLTFLTKKTRKKILRHYSIAAAKNTNSQKDDAYSARL
jgi:hypothetical protein